MRSYQDKLRDPRWQKKRLEILQRDDFSCSSCESKDKTLHVHHKWYERGMDPWQYPDGSMETLCEECHSQATETDRMLLACIRGMDLGSKHIMIGVAYGLWMNEETGYGYPIHSYETALGLSLVQKVDPEKVVTHHSMPVLTLSDIEEIRRAVPESRELRGVPALQKSTEGMDSDLGEDLPQNPR